MKFGLKEDTIAKINSILVKFPQVEEAVLYGSRAKGNYKPGSDIDLTLKGENINYSLLSEISMQIDDLLLPYMFDLSVYHQLNSPDIIEHIDRVGQVFYSKKGS